MHMDLCNVVMHVHAGLCNANLYVRVGLQYVMQVYMCIGLYNVGLMYKGLCNVSLYVHVSLHVCSGGQCECAGLYGFAPKAGSDTGLCEELSYNPAE